MNVKWGRVRITISLICFFSSIQVDAQDSTYVPNPLEGGDCECPLEIEHETIRIPSYTNLEITIAEISTASFNDFYALIENRPGSEPIKIYFFQRRIPEPGEIWIVGPLKAGDKIDFRIHSEILAERTTCDPNRWGEIHDLGYMHWQINFEDWCDFDWNDLVVDIRSMPGHPTISILTPAHLASFVTDDASTFRVHAEAWATDLYGLDISRWVDWFVRPNSISGRCRPSVRGDSREFDFVASNIPARNSRGLGRLQYSIFAVSTPYFIPIWDLNVMVQDDIDTVRQQYVDYTIKLPYKSRFALWEGHSIIHPEPVLLGVFASVCPCYRLWAGNANARCEITSSFRSPDHNRDPDVGGMARSLHQYGLAIDIGYNDQRLPGKKDDALAIIECINTLRLPNIYPFDHRKEGYNHVHLQNYHYWNMPYIER